VRLGAGMAGNYLADQAVRPFISREAAAVRRDATKGKNARLVREGLQELRGPVMKLGQALSMQTNDLDPQWIKELSSLQMQAPPMHPTLMRAQFKGAMGRAPEELFRSLEPVPFAAASLGQVHHAVTKKGEPVVVKIQYPAIREAIETDFGLLRTAGLAARLTGHLPEAVISEIQRGILEETDYGQEAKNIEFFRQHLAPLPFVRVPKVYPELSGQQVLTMSRVSGLRMDEFLQAGPPRELCDTLGAGLTRLFFFQLFRMQALHADPHPGNYLFNEDGTIGMVDFGCVKYLKPEMVRCYQQFWSREWMHDPAIYGEIVSVLFGRLKPATARACMEEIGRFYNKFHPLTDPPLVLDVGDPAFMDALLVLAKVLISNKFLAPDFLFLSRAESGTCNLLHLLKARIATTGIVREFLEPEGRKRGPGGIKK
jgi:predicted unusual protein kinase regulating ubiquinone biosynthesis (AarF/ABC1/UbiB family)